MGLKAIGVQLVTKTDGPSFKYTFNHNNRVSEPISAKPTSQGGCED